MGKKSKFDWTLIIWIAGILLIFWGLTNLKININVPQQNQSYSIVPDTQQPVYSTCSQVCYANGFSKYYNFIDTCKPGENKITYGYPNQAPLLTCCCYNEQTTTPQNICTDSDGDNRDTPGYVTFGDTYTDKCLEVGQAVTEYICLNGIMSSKNWMCDYGEVCIQSRSGGYCKKSEKVWNPGDTVAQGSGSGTLIGGDSAYAELNLNDYGLNAGGNCRLGVQIQTSWDYVSPECTGLQGFEGVEWQFWDSAGLEYARVDPRPISLAVDLNPGNGHTLEWDGVTPWKGKLIKMLNIPGCVISDNWSVRVYIYDCV